MLYIITQTSHGRLSRNFHIGENVSIGIEVDKVVLVQADGDELERIINSVNNIPHIEIFESNKRVQIWRGALAQFIVDNVDFTRIN